MLFLHNQMTPFGNGAARLPRFRVCITERGVAGLQRFRLNPPKLGRHRAEPAAKPHRIKTEIIKAIIKTK